MSNEEEVLEPRMRLQQELEFYNKNHDSETGRFTGPGVAGKIVKALQDSPEGGTLEPESGEHVTTGYMVGMGNKLKGTIEEKPKESFSVESVRNWLRRKAVREALKKNKVRAKIGFWEQDGQIFMEPSEQFVNKTMAVNAGTTQSEYSIFHLDTNQNIPTSKQALDDLKNNIPEKN